MARKTVDMTIKLVDYRDRTLTTYSYPAGPIAKAEWIAQKYRERWNESGCDRCEGFYVWDDCGNMITYG